MGRGRRPWYTSRTTRDSTPTASPAAIPDWRQPHPPSRPCVLTSLRGPASEALEQELPRDLDLGERAPRRALRAEVPLQPLDEGVELGLVARQVEAIEPAAARRGL